MGQRTAKRDWRPCPAGRDCHHGVTADRAWLDHWVHLLLTAAASPDHPWVRSVPLVDAAPTGALAEITTVLAGRAPRDLGHDALDRRAATIAILQAAGLDEWWGYCPGCNGHCIHPDDLAASEAGGRPSSHDQ